LEFVRYDVAIGRIFTVEDHITSYIKLVYIMFFNNIGWVDENKFSSGNSHLPFVEARLLSGG
jgi:hypothetical protein